MFFATSRSPDSFPPGFHTRDLMDIDAGLKGTGDPVASYSM